MWERPKLFLNYREFLIFVLLSLAVIIIRLGIIYNSYRVFISKPFYFTSVEVLQQYRGGKHTILKVHSHNLDLIFFTKTYRKDNLLDKIVRLKLFPSKDMSFFDYLGVGYINSKIVDIVESNSRSSLKSTLLESITKQHNQNIIVEFYQAIFLAKPISKELRGAVSMLGISHLIAMSGFHISILFGVIFFLINIIYKFFQKEYFPYRFNLIDVGFITLFMVGLYVYFVDAPPSLIRAYFMMIIGWVTLILGVEIVSFSFIVVVTLTLLAIFPKMLLSLAFWFSLLGVFYIFLLIDRFKNIDRLAMTTLISFGIFILMSPIVHTIFPLTSPLQLYSPLLSLLFILFYPFSLFLHTIGYGWVFDDLLFKLFTMETQTTNILLPIYYGICYIMLSIGAVYSKWLFYLLFLMAIIFNLVLIFYQI